MEDLDFRFSNKLQAINEMEKTVKNLSIKSTDMQEQIDKNYNEFLDAKESLLEQIEENSQKIKAMGSHSARISKLEDDFIQMGLRMEKEKKESAVDYDKLCSK